MSEPPVYYQQEAQVPYYQQPVEQYVYVTPYSNEIYSNPANQQYYSPSPDNFSSYPGYPTTQYSAGNSYELSEQQTLDPRRPETAKYNRGSSRRNSGNRRMGVESREASSSGMSNFSNAAVEEDSQDSAQQSTDKSDSAQQPRHSAHGLRGGRYMNRAGARQKYSDGGRGRYANSNTKRHNVFAQSKYPDNQQFQNNEHSRQSKIRIYSRPSDDDRMEERQSLLRSLHVQNNSSDSSVGNNSSSTNEKKYKARSSDDNTHNQIENIAPTLDHKPFPTRHSKGGNQKMRHFQNSYHADNIKEHQLTFSKHEDDQKSDVLDGVSNHPKVKSHSGKPVKQKPRQNIGRKVEEGQRGLLIDQLTDGTYECMVCCDAVRRHNAVWSCSSCYHVFHLFCTKKWARSPAAVIDGQIGWRCPACQKVSERVPNQYRCFCGKVRDPELDRRETPHSCGEVCGKKRGDSCRHACNILCHPGPCPPCSANINKKCLCGKITQNVKCIQSSSFQCSKSCSKQLNCGKHFCSQVCHEGGCSPCDTELAQECFGKHTSRKVICGTKESFQTVFSCDAVCDRLLKCGSHKCSSTCHIGECEQCSLLPSVVTTCPCGKVELEELEEKPRQSCTDPIPTCSNICDRLLPCSSEENVHRCKLKCHEGECGDCDGNTVLRCRCGAVEKDFTCTEAKQFMMGSPFTCEKRCTKKRSCGRHRCNQSCCVAEEHRCEFVCGAKLKCGLHKCDEPCHKGNCPPCLQASFEELTCHCGCEVLFPPVPCGTRPPECRRPCNRVHACHHEQHHTCHSDEKCPPCAVFTEKWCHGHHELRKNIPCYLTELSCGLQCNKPLPCGKHKCLKKCHKGDCFQDDETCTQPCNVQRKLCSHPCGVPCHSSTPCPDVSCNAQVVLKCPCGRRTAKSMCAIGGDAQNVQEFQKIMIQKLGGLDLNDANSMDMSHFSSSKRASNRQLDCDEECAIAERNKRFAVALEIKNPELRAKLGNPSYSDFLKDSARQYPHFVSSVEKSLLELVQAAKQSKQNYKSHAFQPMNRNQRQIIHELCELYGCESQSYDNEPKRNVVAIAHRDKCFLPSVTLTSFIQRELYPRAPPPIPLVHKEEEIRKSAMAAKLSTEVKTQPKTKTSAQIDYFDFSPVS